MFCSGPFWLVFNRIAVLVADQAATGSAIKGTEYQLSADAPLLGSSPYRTFYPSDSEELPAETELVCASLWLDRRLGDVPSCDRANRTRAHHEATTERCASGSPFFNFSSLEPFALRLAGRHTRTLNKPYKQAIPIARIFFARRRRHAARASEALKRHPLRGRLYQQGLGTFGIEERVCCNPSHYWDRLRCWP
jgi:hypothetical protein